MTRQTLLCMGALGAALAALISLSPSPAAACGGTFCDSGPTVMPVDQTGESILFWVDQSGPTPFTEAHIQIQYEGDAERFAWIIPVTGVPEVQVGSQALFDNTLLATVPSFSTSTTIVGDCSDASVGCGGLRGIEPDEIDIASDDEGDWGDEDPTGEEGPEILDRGFAGAFEFVTLTGNNVDEITTWLGDNGYAQDEDAPPILAEYLQEGFVFVAVKLQSGAGVEEIHPLTLRYPGTEPCIPIRLTRIAAVDDMAIRAFFLGEGRFAGQNWPHVELNHSRLDWVNGPALSYQGLVSLALDEAEGRAWLTEYVGTPDIVSTSGIASGQWNVAAFEGIEAIDVVTELISQGLVDCSGEAGCQPIHAQVEPLLQTYLPPPEGIDAWEFWSCLECNVDTIDLTAWEADPGFAAGFDERIVGPGQHAVAMLEGALRLTRLFTLLSPHEMIEDPLFHEISDSATVDNTLLATRANDCGDGPSYFDLPDGRRVALSETNTMPLLDGNPAALRIERFPMMGPAQVEVDNAALIDGLLDTWNASRLEGPSGCSITGVGFGGALGFLGIFTVLLFNRRPRSDAA